MLACIDIYWRMSLVKEGVSETICYVVRQGQVRESKQARRSFIYVHMRKGGVLESMRDGAVVGGEFY